MRPSVSSLGGISRNFLPFRLEHLCAGLVWGAEGAALGGYLCSAVLSPATCMHPDVSSSSAHPALLLPPDGTACTRILMDIEGLSCLEHGSSSLHHKNVVGYVHNFIVF